MKKLLIIIILQLPAFVFAQVDSVDIYVRKFIDQYITSINPEKITIKDKDSVFLEKMISEIEKYKNDTNNTIISRLIGLCRKLAIYGVIKDYLYFYNEDLADTLQQINRTLKIRQRAVNYILDVYNYPGIRGTGRGLWMFEAEDFDQQARQKIAFLLSGNITNSDFERHKAVYKKGLRNLYDRRITRNTFDLYDILQQEIKKNGKPDSIVRDSLYKVWKERDLKNFKLPKIYNIELLHVIGRNYMYEFEPQIRSLMDTVPGFPVYFCKLIFARFGREPFVTDFFKSVENIELIPYSWSEYIVSQQVSFVCKYPQSFNFLVNWLNTEYYTVYAPFGKPLDSLDGTYNACYYIAGICKNFPSRYRGIPIYQDEKKSIEPLVDVTKKWLEENKDNIVLDSMVYSFFYPMFFLKNDLNSVSFKEEYEKDKRECKKKIN